MPCSLFNFPFIRTGTIISIANNKAAIGISTNSVLEMLFSPKLIVSAPIERPFGAIRPHTDKYKSNIKNVSTQNIPDT